MGADALRSNGITKKVLYLIKDKNLTSKQDPLNKVRKSRIILFIGVQLVGFGVTFAITQTFGPFRYMLMISILMLTSSSSGDRFSRLHHVAFAYTYLYHSSHVFHKRRTRYPRRPYCITIRKLLLSHVTFIQPGSLLFKTMKSVGGSF